MTKEEFSKYKGLPQERDYLIRKIAELERKLESVPTISTVVQTSQKEWPYIEKHLKVEAQDPVKASSYKRRIRRHKASLEAKEKLLDNLYALIDTIEDSRARQILTKRYIEGEKLKNIARQQDLTEQQVLNIINKSIKNIDDFNKF